MKTEEEIKEELKEELKNEMAGCILNMFFVIFIFILAGGLGILISEFLLK